MDIKKLPEWANWLATDQNGDVNAFENRPYQDSFYWQSVGGRFCQVESADNLFVKNWRETLKKIVRVNGHSGHADLASDEQLVYLADVQPSTDKQGESEAHLSTAPDLLARAASIMTERGKQYDQPDGERSMGKTIVAFNAITGRDLSEAEGWLLLQLLKDARQWQRPGYHADSAEDCIAYAALKAEAKQNEAIYKSTTAETGN